MTISLEINALPYALAAEDEASTLSRFARLRTRPDAVLLDSGQPSLAGGRFDIISSDPLAVLEQGPQGGKLTGPLPETMRDLSQFSEALERLARLPVIEAQRQLLTLLPQTLAGEELARHDLSAEQMTEVMRTIMTGGATPAQIGGFLIGLRMKGESVTEIAAAAAVMRQLASGVDIGGLAHTVDIVGTGGDASGSFNVSTNSMFAVAGAGCTAAATASRVDDH